MTHDSYDRAGTDHSVFRDDDNPIPDVVTVAVGVLDAPLVTQPHAVSDSGVLVDNHAVEHHVAADPQSGVVAARRRIIVRLEEVSAEQHGAENDGARLN